MRELQFALIHARRFLRLDKVIMTMTKTLDDHEMMQCIDSALEKFGPGIKYAVYWRMVALNQSPNEGIIANPEGFVEALNSVFGNSAKQIEQAITDEIRSRIGEFYPATTLPSLISQIRKEKLLVQAMPLKKRGPRTLPS